MITSSLKPFNTLPPYSALCSAHLDLHLLNSHKVSPLSSADLAQREWHVTALAWLRGSSVPNGELKNTKARNEIQYPGEVVHLQHRAKCFSRVRSYTARALDIKNAFSIYSFGKRFYWRQFTRIKVRHTAEDLLKRLVKSCTVCLTAMGVTPLRSLARS